ncbi:MAG: peptide chain release factor N(5)-glutamine methyltransferase [Candidatus Saccharimonadia bacterium]
MGRTIEEQLKHAKNRLAGSRIPSARLDSELLLAHALKTNREYILAHSDQVLTKNQQTTFEGFIEKRAQRLPLVHLTGKKEFYGLDVSITADVLTPRVETETMVDWAINSAPKGSRVLDMGTGSGALAIALAKHRPDLKLTASDISEQALQVARQNALSHKLNIKFIHSNMWQNINGTFDIIVCNLPYLKTDAELLPEVKNEPGVALFGGNDGLELYREFFLRIQTFLNPTGIVYTECDPWQQEKLANIATTSGLVKVREDYFIMEFKN